MGTAATTLTVSEGPTDIQPYAVADSETARSGETAHRLPVCSHPGEAMCFTNVRQVQDVLLEAAAAEANRSLQVLRADAAVSANAARHLSYIRAFTEHNIITLLLCCTLPSCCSDACASGNMWRTVRSTRRKKQTCNSEIWSQSCHMETSVRSKESDLPHPTRSVAEQQALALRRTSGFAQSGDAAGAMTLHTTTDPPQQRSIKFEKRHRCDRGKDMKR